MKTSHIKYIFSVLFLLVIGLSAGAQKAIPDDFCITDDEYRLYELINAHRLINGLKEIPLSASLSFVARTHVIDLYTNHPDTSICNLNSWSDKGDWIPCCHNKYVPAEQCIRNKPKELTKYTGEGYELTYAEVFNTNADTVFRFWKKIDKPQNAGPAAAVVGGVEVISNNTGRYYVVISSFQSNNDAQREAKKYTAVSGSNLKIIKNPQGQFRVSINDYPSLEAAKQGKEVYEKQFNGAWILSF